MGACPLPTMEVTEMNVTIDWYAVRLSTVHPSGASLYKVFCGHRERAVVPASSYDEAIAIVQHS